MTEIVYVLYLVIAIGITIWVARILSRSGVVFLTQCFGQNETLAGSTNHLLIVGFYLVNIGFITLALSLGDEPTTITGAMRFLSGKVGLAVLVLGAMHFFNMGAIAQLGRKVNGWVGHHEGAAVAPVAEAAASPR